MSKDSLGDRMKRYEKASKTSLVPRMPIIVRVDGKAFHTYTKNLNKPFDGRLINVMNEVAIMLFREIQGAQLAYIQSDEISILLHPYKRYASQAWFDGELQKMVSVSAAIASAEFTIRSHELSDVEYYLYSDDFKAAYFDSRAFTLPEREVNNYFIWRQNDTQRNSVQMFARSLFTHKECDRKSCDELKTMCLEVHGEDWNNLGDDRKHGRVVLKGDGVECRPAPIFKENPSWVESLLEVEEE